MDWDAKARHHAEKFSARFNPRASGVNAAEEEHPGVCVVYGTAAQYDPVLAGLQAAGIEILGHSPDSLIGAFAIYARGDTERIKGITGL